MKHKITIEFEEVEHTCDRGFRVEWCSGVRGKGKKQEKVSVTTGAGVGSPFLIYSREQSDDHQIQLVANVKDIVAALNKIPFPIP